MVVKRRTFESCGVGLVMGLLVAGCTPDPGTVPTAAPTPSASSPATRPTSTENTQERQQRLDFEAAEKAYLAADAEVHRLAMRGGASEPTKVLLENTAGRYLKARMGALRTLKSREWRTDRPTTVTVTADGGWSQDELQLTACEDASNVRLLDEDGEEVAKDRQRRIVQTLTATKAQGRWKVANLDSKAVSGFDNEPACQQ
jgi:hypothetical protein